VNGSTFFGSPAGTSTTAAGWRELRSAQAEAAERTLSEALSLWRGPPLADFRFDPFAQAEIRRLEQLHGKVVADRIDARLAQGRAEGVIGELERLVEANPLWERPRRLLMLALYRAGRQADALEVYRKTRTLFDDELGLESSPELQALERAILNQDTSLAGPEPELRQVLRRRGGTVVRTRTARSPGSTRRAARSGSPRSPARSETSPPLERGSR
jgi:DNA-binding SARP family transcriptional activator